MTPQRIQFSRRNGWHKPPNTVVVSRPSRFGNPFKWNKHKVEGWTEAQHKAWAVEQFREWLMGEMIGKHYPEKKKYILDHLHDLRGKNLACYCKPDEPCHADVLLKLANTQEVEAQ